MQEHRQLLIGGIEDYITSIRSESNWLISNILTSDCLFKKSNNFDIQYFNNFNIIFVYRQYMLQFLSSECALELLNLPNVHINVQVSFWFNNFFVSLLLYDLSFGSVPCWLGSYRTYGFEKYEGRKPILPRWQ